LKRGSWVALFVRAEGKLQVGVPRKMTAGRFGDRGAGKNDRVAKPLGCLRGAASSSNKLEHIEEEPELGRHAGHPSPEPLFIKQGDEFSPQDCRSLQARACSNQRSYMKMNSRNRRCA